MFGSSEMIIVLVIVLVLFGGSQLPKLAKNLGKAQKEFKDGVNEANQADAAANTDAASSNTANAKNAPADAPAEWKDTPPSA